MPDVTLYNYWRSSASYRVRIALHLKNIAFKYVTVNLAGGEQLESAYREKNPMGHVPALYIDGELFTESVAILEYLDEAHAGPRLFPQDARGKARVRALVETINSGVQPLQNLVVLKRIGEGPKQEWLEYFMGRGLGTFEALMQRNEAHGIKGPFAYGETLSAADCALVPQVYSALRFNVSLAAFPRVTRAYAAALAHPAVVLSVPEAQADAAKA
jgi:maleylacetoacetate isomerase